MTTTLRVIIDQLTGPTPGGMGRYAEDLTSAIVAATPSGCEVEGVVSAVTPEQTADLEQRLPGLARITRVPLPRRELSRAWQLGLPTPGTSGMVHAPGLLAPLRRHDRVNTNDQIVATIHDVNAWTHPESMTSASVSWTKAMAKRARKHADAVVVPSHALAEEARPVRRPGRPRARHRRRREPADRPAGGPGRARRGARPAGRLPPHRRQPRAAQGRAGARAGPRPSRDRRPAAPRRRARHVGRRRGSPRSRTRRASTLRACAASGRCRTATSRWSSTAPRSSSTRASPRASASR
ncbi:glycosyltransferase [Clavibacter tessellarius]|uniref:glycosyltransferase n=1 Tax=Clavibacter tessellarius TaxID=31965 RepID=UPI003249FAF9